MEVTYHDAAQAVKTLIAYAGDDILREGLGDTPARVVGSYSELFRGYLQDPADIITTFEDGTCDQMVILKDIEFFSTCEHHMLPFFGKAHIAYLPNQKIIGISKLARLLDIFARRLQIQERIGTQVVKALAEHLNPLGAGCIIEAKHLCMACRGVEKQNSVMVTSSLIGEFQDDPAVKEEFFTLVKL